MHDAQHRRVSKRKPIALQVRLAFNDVADFTERYATNISDGGIFIRSRDPRPVGTRLKFELRLRSGEVAFEGDGVVRWVQGLDARGLGVPGMGLQFEQLTDESRAVLDRILAERAKDGCEVVEGANPARWRPLEEFPPVEEEPVEETEEPAAPPVMSRVQGFAPVDRPETTAPLLPAIARQTRPVPRAPTGDRNPTGVGLHLNESTLRLATGTRTLQLPAAVAVSAQGEIVYGEAALEVLEQGGHGTRGLGGLLGLRPETEAARTWERRHLLRVLTSDDPRPALQLAGRRVSATSLCEALIRHALDALQNLGEEPGRVVVAMPTGLPEPRRRALREVALACGLQVESMAPAPLLGVLARFGHEGQRRVLVVDVSEGSLEVAVVEQSGHVLDVAASLSTTRVGGIDLDLALVTALLARFEEETELPVPEDLGLFERVRVAAVEAREALGDSLECEVYLPNLVEAGLSRADLRQKVTRARLQTLAAPLVDQVLEVVRSVLTVRGLGPGELDEVLLMGDHARLPLLVLRLQELFGREPVRADDAFGVARGAVLVAEGHSAFARFVLTGTVSTPLWVAPASGPAKRLLERGLPLPAQRSYVAVAEEGRLELELGLFQGEKGTDDEDLVGTLLVGPIPAPPHGELARVTVHVTMDDAGDVSVQARAMHGAEVPTALDRSRTPSR